jgi:DNA-binding transcriptional ArsR family regulator
MAKVAEGEGLLVALRHPLRREILRTMIGRRKISPREVADVLRDPLSNVSYHVRVLVECGVIELVDEAPVRGSIQHFYRASIDEPWALSALGLEA